MAVVYDQLVAMPIASVPKHDDVVRFLQMGVVLTHGVMLVLHLLGVVAWP